MSWIYSPITKELPPNYNGLNPLPSGGACLLHIKESVRSTTDCGAGEGELGVISAGQAVQGSTGGGS